MQISKTISGLDYSTERWDLYTYDDERAQESIKCAQRLNIKFTELVNSGASKRDVRRAMNALMHEPENIKCGERATVSPTACLSASSTRCSAKLDKLVDVSPVHARPVTPTTGERR